ncbi:MAG: 6-phosphofructokinase, partial [Bacillota bacterium]
MRIGILTSGGDAPGMNAAIRAVVRKGIYDGHQIIGFKRGFNGLISGEMTPMNLGSVADIIHRGGTMLHTARSSKFMTPEGLDEAMNTLKGERFDGLIVIGGDGSMRGAKTIAACGIRVACIPASIDNDIPCTDMSIGFDTALNT